jgi:hypothetical protein
MVICIVALVVFSILGIFSARYRKLSKEAFSCVFSMMTFRPCKTNLDQRIKSKVTAKLIKRAPAVARFFYKNFRLISVIFTISFFASLIYSAYGIYNLVVFGSCTPGDPGSCQINQLAYLISCYESQFVYGIIIIAVVIGLYFGLRKHVEIELR